MKNQELDEDLLNVVRKLKEKYDDVGEDLTAHFEGMLYSYYINYWDYIGVDALLNLQKPKTKYPDEMIFIVYHQITELYFKIILYELEQIGFRKDFTADFFLKKLERVNKYFTHLVQSFEVLYNGMDGEQFLKFRKAIIPASGFQSIQYRLIELWSTSFQNLVSNDHRHKFNEQSTIEEMFEFLYWRQGAIDEKTKQKTLTLVQFEEKYGNLIARKGKEFKQKNVLYRYRELSEKDQQNKQIITQLRQFDLFANVNWPLAHLKYAVKYLQSKNGALKSTGGTNWKQYLPPKFQKQIFYPELWSEEEKENWGKNWIESVLLENTKEA